jgi:hypothetical protein
MDRYLLSALRGANASMFGDDDVDDIFRVAEKFLVKMIAGATAGDRRNEATADAHECRVKCHWHIGIRVDIEIQVLAHHLTPCIQAFGCCQLMEPHIRHHGCHGAIGLWRLYLKHVISPIRKSRNIRKRLSFFAGHHIGGAMSMP